MISVEMTSLPMWWREQEAQQATPALGAAVHCLTSSLEGGVLRGVFSRSWATLPPDERLLGLVKVADGHFIMNGFGLKF